LTTTGVAVKNDEGPSYDEPPSVNFEVEREKKLARRAHASGEVTRGGVVRLSSEDNAQDKEGRGSGALF